MYFVESVIAYRNSGYVAGQVQVTDAPEQRKVSVLDAVSFEQLNSCVSLTTGEFMIVGLDTNKEYIVIARDYQKQYEPVSYDYVKPASDITTTEQLKKWQEWVQA